MVTPAGIAVKAQEAMGQHSAREIGAKLALHETGHRVPVLPGAGEGGLAVH